MLVANGDLCLYSPLTLLSQYATNDDMSTLSEYVKNLDGTPKGEIAERFGISRPYLYGLLDETRSPSLPVAMRIAAATGGAVPITSWPNLAAIVDAASEGAA